MAEPPRIPERGANDGHDRGGAGRGPPRPGAGLPPLRRTPGRVERGAGAARAGEPSGSGVGGGRAGAGAPPLCFRSFRDFIRVLPGAAQRFWVLVIATGLLSGIGAGVLLYILRVVQGLAWPQAEGGFVARVEAASPRHRVLVPAAAGLIVCAIGLIARRPLAG